MEKEKLNSLKNTTLIILAMAAISLVLLFGGHQIEQSSFGDQIKKHMQAFYEAQASGLPPSLSP